MSRKDELYHYGVKGMKWGKRKAIREYLDAKKKGSLDRSAKEALKKKQGKYDQWVNSHVRNHSKAGAQEELRNRARSSTPTPPSEPKRKHWLAEREYFDNDILSRIKRSLPTEKNSVEYNERKHEIAAKTAKRMFENYSAKHERGLNPSDKEFKRASEVMGGSFEYGRRANNARGSVHDTLYRAAKSTKSKAKSFISKLRKKKR